MGFQEEAAPTSSDNASIQKEMSSTVTNPPQGDNRNRHYRKSFRKSMSLIQVEMPSEEDCMKTFDDADLDGDGQLCSHEVCQLVLKIWPDFNNKPAIERAYNRSDLDESGFIDRDEFEFFIRLLSYYNNLWSVFASTDENGDWKLSKDEFCNAAEDLGIKRKAEEVFDEIRISENGEEDYVNFDEFCHWMTSHTSTRQRGGGRVVDAASAQLLADAMMAFGEDEQSYLSRCFIQIRCSLDILKCNGKVSDEIVESWATTIHGSMSGENRGYHTVRRMFHVSDMADPYQMLALTFGDVVDYAVDGGVSSYAGNTLDDVYKIDDDDFMIIQPIDDEKDPATSLAMSIFGYHPGLSLVPRKSTSRFLSAVFAARTLQKALSLADLAKILVCIFATGLPLLRDEGKAAVQSFYFSLEKNRKTSIFRNNIQNFDPNIGRAENLVNKLHERLILANGLHELGMAEGDIVNAIQRGVDSSNRDVGWIATDDVVDYFESCWSLLPEITPALRRRKLYTVADYHEGVKNLENYLSSLNVETIFFSFQALPSALDVGHLVEKALQNQELGIIYTKVKLVSQCILAAFAEVSGGNVPIVYFKGDAGANRDGERSTQLHDSIPILSRAELALCNITLYDILANGRKSKIGSSKSILSAFVYGKLGDRGIQRLHPYTKYPLTKDTAMVLLKALPTDVSIPIGEAIASISVGRYEIITDLIKELDPAHDKEETQKTKESEVLGSLEGSGITHCSHDSKDVELPGAHKNAGKKIQDSVSRRVRNSITKIGPLKFIKKKRNSLGVKKVRFWNFLAKKKEEN